MNLISVIDCETTGLNASHSDRIVEIAVVVIDTNGKAVREFVSLVNPSRDVGKTSCHRITASDVAEAPAFSDIIGHITEVLDGTIAVAAHNAGFDHRFLLREFERAGVIAPTVPTLCTMRLSGGGSLECCCRDLGLEFDPQSAHMALEDARVAARLFARLCDDGMLDLRELRALPPIRWPKLPHAKAAPLSRAAARDAASAQPSYIRRLLAHAGPFSVVDVNENMAFEYLGTLEQALEDRYVDKQEEEVLVRVARSLGLDGEAIEILHGGYLDRLIAAALDDGVITAIERLDIEAAGRLLGFDDEYVRQSLASAHSQRSMCPSSTSAVGRPSLAGKSVCFTGESVCSYHGQPITRETADALAVAAGLEIADSVTKQLDVLVVADPSTQSSKARKARQYGTRIIHEPLFWQMLGVAVE